MRIRLVRDDITRVKADAIVNAANTSLMGGGGVDGAIHSAGGPQILAECRKIAAQQGGCPTGEAVITGAGNLPARYVIHTVGPVWGRRGLAEAALLASCYRKSLALAESHGLRSVAFPNISTGVYGYPKKEAARIALEAIRDYFEAKADSLLEEIVLVCYDAENFSALENTLGLPEFQSLRGHAR